MVIILGFFAFFQWEFSLAVLAAVLAVLGYSVNESVVIFDRIRETFRRFRKMTTREVIDHAITSTISRTIITHGSTQMMVLSMLLFGGPTLHYFAVALTIGILFGIYSSVFVAAAIAMWLGVKREDLVKRRRQGRTTRTIRTPGPWCRVGQTLDVRTHHMTRRRSVHAISPSRRGGSTPNSWSSGVAGAGQRGARDGPLAARQAGRACRRIMRRRELVQGLKTSAASAGSTAMVDGLRNALLGTGVSAARAGRSAAARQRRGPLSLVDDDTIEREILTSRLALAIMDRASWEFTDLRSRMSSLERRDELDAHDMLRAHVLARVARRCLARCRAEPGRLARAAGGAARRVRACWSKRPTTRPTAG